MKIVTKNKKQKRKAQHNRLKKIKKTDGKNRAHHIDPLFEKLFASAKAVLKNAYSPYSHIQVASAVMMSDGQVYTGCNVENSSYGATICAERVAITKAISTAGHKTIKALLVTTNQSAIWPPCGVCRQFISEFSDPSTLIYAANLKKEYKQVPFHELLPSAFSKSHFDRFRS